MIASRDSVIRLLSLRSLAPSVCAIAIICFLVAMRFINAGTTEILYSRQHGTVTVNLRVPRPAGGDASSGTAVADASPFTDAPGNEAQGVGTGLQSPRGPPFAESLSALEPASATEEGVSLPGAVPATGEVDQSLESANTAPTHVDLAAMPCPTTYIYFDAPVVDGGVKAADVSKAVAFGRPHKFPGVYESSQFNLALVMLYRLQNSRHCPVTLDPAKADLFVIPVLMHPKGNTEWEQLCENDDLWGDALVEGEGGTTLRFLPHLNAETAHRHVFFISKGHYVAAKGESCAWIRGEPPAAPYFANIQRFAYSHTYSGFKFGGRRTTRKHHTEVSTADGRVVSVPYPPWIHWSRKAFTKRAPWQSFDDRGTRIHFVAGMHGKQVDLRRRLFSDCVSLGEPKCRAIDTFGEHVLLEKQRAVFCLEPEGDSPFRKSVYDSIVSGW